MKEEQAGRPELLAPAGDWDCLVAAVQNGADAVYLGGREFSARQSAGNFDAEEMARAVAYAHVRGVRVYAAVNTLIKERELPAVLEYAVKLYALGIDALIVQDLGLVRLLAQALPGFPLHASTQMTVHHQEAVRWLARHGVERVVLARELSLEEIAECVRSGLAAEVFVHGALCVSYSGQCLMSSLIGGRSGNRGRCAQPCRLEYTLVDQEGRPLAEAEEVGAHLLSTKDLAALDLLRDLAAAGVTALKIEGRMKRPEYVATVVRLYHEALAGLGTAERRTQAAGDERRWRELAQAFNRGFTPGYLLGNPGRELMSFQRPSNRGVFLGRVAFYDRRRGLATLTLDNAVAVGDGLEFWVSQGGRVGVTLSRFWSADRRDGAARPKETAGPGEKIVIPVQGAIRTGDRVFKTSDAALQAQAAATFRSPRESLQIPLRAILTVRRGAPAHLVFEDPAGLQGSATGTVLASQADKRALTEDEVREHLGRLGNTPFKLAELVLMADPDTLVPWSELNALRRAALAQLEEAEVARRRPTAEQARAARVRVREVLREREGRLPVARPASPAGLPALTVAIGGLEALDGVLAARPERVILSGERFQPAEAAFYRTAEVAEAARRCRAAGAALSLGFPRIIRRGEMERAASLAEEVSLLAGEERPAALLVGNLGLLHRLNADRRGEADATLPALHADWPLNLFNSESLVLLAEEGVAEATLSPELTLAEVEEVIARSPIPCELLVHGPLELMVSEYCALGAVVGGRAPGHACKRPCRAHQVGLRDRLGLVFPLRMDASCRMHVANPKELCLVEHLPALVSAGPAAIRLDCRLREPEYAARVAGVYREALTAMGQLGREETAAGGLKEELAAWRRELEDLAPSGITKGHYFRGVE